MPKKKKWNLRTRIMSKLREVSRWDPDGTEAFLRARRGKFRINGRLVWHHECAMCKNLFPYHQVQKDHIEPVVRLSGFKGDWNTVIERLFPGPDGYQILCIPCHTQKTLDENSRRKKAA